MHCRHPFRATLVVLAAALAPAVLAATPPPKAPRVERFSENPIIRPEMLPGTDGANICGPSLIRVPDWLPNPLGKYYLYFADHKGTYIRLAYAERVQGPWTIHRPGTLQLADMVAVAKAAAGAAAGDVKGNHIASPDVHVDHERKQIRMYFHFQIAPSATWGHRSGVALSTDGLQFKPVGTKPIGQPYLRVFRRDGYYYAIDRSARLSRSRDGLGEFEVGNTEFAAVIGHKTLAGYDAPPAPAAPAVAGKKQNEGEDAGAGIRHTAVKIDGDRLTVFFSRVGDLPEILMCAQVEMKGDWRTWRLSAPVAVLRPEHDYEGVSAPPRTPSNAEMRVLPRPLFNDLRDPCVHRENGTTFLLYSVAGERGIAGAVLKE